MGALAEHLKTLGWLAAVIYACQSGLVPSENRTDALCVVNRADADEIYNRSCEFLVQ